MNTDHYFAIGQTHEVCEDYALSGVTNGVGYAIVCDGCSSSEGVDFGARALAYTARLFITAHTDIFFTGSPDEIGKLIIDRAKMLTEFGISRRALDATLVVAAVRGDTLRICLWGDGVAAIRRPSGSSAYHVDYESNAPYYLSYGLDPARQLAYRDEFNLPKKVTFYVTGNPPMRNEVLNDYWASSEFSHKVAAGDIVAVTSDGINTFRKPDTELLPWEAMLDEFTGFKNTNGTFVTRRMKFFQRHCAKELITHDDDISVAAIVV